MYLVISCSLNSQSKSRLLAKEAHQQLVFQGCNAELIDMREWVLPYCDGEQASHDERVTELAAKIEKAQAILISVPIYNYDVNAVARGLVELTGKCWEGKLVGFLCAAGGKGSYMAPMGLANSLFLHYHCFILPRFVYATGDQFSDECIVDAEVTERIEQQIKMFVGVSSRLQEL